HRRASLVKEFTTEDSRPRGRFKPIAGWLLCISQRTISRRVGFVAPKLSNSERTFVFPVTQRGAPMSLSVPQVVSTSLRAVAVAALIAIPCLSIAPQRAEAQV